jgi:hypothetical protein
MEAELAKVSVVDGNVCRGRGVDLDDGAGCMERW